MSNWRLRLRDRASPVLTLSSTPTTAVAFAMTPTQVYKPKLPQLGQQVVRAVEMLHERLRLYAQALEHAGTVCANF